jgi:hypothetical protein
MFLACGEAAGLFGHRFPDSSDFLSPARPEWLVAAPVCKMT